RAVCFDRHFAFRKQPGAAEFFRTESEMIVTRGYEPPIAEVRPSPRVARRGTAYVRACVDEAGTPNDVTVLEGLGEDADATLTTTLRGWKWRPAKLRGEAIPACRVLRLGFP